MRIGGRAVLVVAAGVLALGAISGVAWLLDRSLSVDPAAGRAAVEQYESRTGAVGARVERAAVWSRCAIVTVGSGEQGETVAMEATARGWSTRRSTAEDSREITVRFDQDDVDSEDECLAIAGSGAEPVAGGMDN